VSHAEVIPNASELDPHESLEGRAFQSALVFSARDPRKGLELAYRGWVAAGRVPEQLQVLAGGGIPKGFHTLAADDLKSGRVVVLPYVAREQLLDILRQAGVLIYPSSVEGFGLPVLEAMATGTPVISGLAPATLEVGGDAIVRIEASDPVASIARHLQMMQADDDWRAELRAKGLRRAGRYSWSRSAEQYLAVYKSVLGRPTGSDDEFDRSS
jgi:alpha-1,3-rhamnosyl/mannosyltransferase